MYCKNCGSDKHFDRECPKNYEPYHESQGVTHVTKGNVMKDVCPECGADKSLMADAEKWRAIREKQRLRMRKRRRKL